MNPTTGVTERLQKLTFAEKCFGLALSAGVILRVIASTLADIGVYVDGALRIAMAMKWAAKPEWLGLSGVWPWFHIYFLGVLIRWWNEPIIIAKVLGVVCGVGTLVVFRNAVRHRWGPHVASLCALFLAVYWTHIWLGTSYWVEIPYLLLVLLAVDYAERLTKSKRLTHALIIGLLLTGAMLLRNEVLLLVVLFACWILLHTKSLRLTATATVLPMALMVWYFIEPAIHGGSYFDYFNFIDRFKGMEMLVDGLSRRESFIQWFLMLGASPTFLIVVPGFYGLWKYRHRARMDLFAWLFLSQFIFHFSLMITSVWRPQLRYLLLQFINLLPYAALVWLEIMQRFSARRVLPLLIATMIVIQSAGWWIGRNDRRPGGWLPLQVITSSQQSVDEFVATLNRDPQSKLKLRSVVPGPRSDRWSLAHSFVVNGNPPNAVELEEIDAHVDAGIMSGVLPPLLTQGDVILIDPEATFYTSVMTALSQREPNLVKKTIHPRVSVILLSDNAKRALAGL